MVRLTIINNSSPERVPTAKPHHRFEVTRYNFLSGETLNFGLFLGETFLKTKIKKGNYT